MNIAEKIRQDIKDAPFKAKVAKFRKLSKQNQFWSKELSTDIGDYTRQKLEEAGFVLSHIKMYGEYDGYLFTW